MFLKTCMSELLSVGLIAGIGCQYKLDMMLDRCCILVDKENRAEGLFDAKLILT